MKRSIGILDFLRPEFCPSGSAFFLNPEGEQLENFLYVLKYRSREKCQSFFSFQTVLQGLLSDVHLSTFRGILTGKRKKKASYDIEKLKTRSIEELAHFTGGVDVEHRRPAPMPISLPLVDCCSLDVARAL